MQPTPFTPSNRRARRGNTIVLVTAILVLLVIIATAFVSRTRAVRQTSAAQQASAGRDGRAESVAMNVAQEIAGALFVKPIDTSDPFSRPDNSVTPPVVVASSSWPRLASPLDAPRYSVDPLDGNGDGFPELGYNFAPYEVKPWTNWPDFFGNSLWPFGPGAPGGQVTDAIGQPIGDGNPYGNPGFGDTRWLRSTEPQRYGFDQNGDGVPERFAFRPAYPPPSGTEPFVSSHWTHLSWLPSANNGWRVVADISDIELNTVTNLNEGAAAPYAVSVPYEQWLPGVFPAPIQNGGQFQNRVQQWFFNYPNAYLDPTVALPNFFHLRELGTPTEEFKLGSLRNVVSRTFTDADGDGFTDSFWFLAPIGTERSIRTLVGVSIVDNSALLNANIATKFSFETTAGATPADLGLVTSAREFLGNQTTTVGFFDGPVNQPSTDAFAIPASNQNNSPLPTYWPGTPQLGFVNGTPRYSRSRYGDAPPFTQPLSFLQSIGMRTPTGLSDRGSYRLGLPLLDETLPQPLPRATFESAAERLAWFKIVGDNPEQPRFGLTPFDAADEFELRAFHGNNMGGTLSRFEQAVSLFSPGLQGGEANDFQFLRSSVQREENDEYLDQLDGRELLVDNRRKLTMFSGARNEIMPPALWTTPLYDPDTNYLNLGAPVPPQSDPNINAFRAANFAEWERQKFKVDLREPTYVDQNGALTLQRNPAAAFRWRRDLQRLLENSLTSAYQPATGATVFSSYLDHPQVQPQNAYWRTRSMIASYVANLDCASDEAIPRTQTLGQFGAVVYADDDPLLPTIPPNQPGSYLPPLTQAVPDPDPQHPDRVYVGMEKQPFIQEVFFGIVYPRSDFSELRWNQEGQANGGCILPASAADIELPDEGDCQVLEGGESYVDLWQPSQTQPPEYPNSRKPRIVAAVQIANPYDTPISLRDFRLSFFDQEYSFAQSILDGYRPDLTLPAATLARPSTAIVYFAPESLADDPNFRQKFLDFIDAEKGEVSNPGGPLQQANLDQDTDDPQFIEFTGPYNSSGGDPLDRTVVLLARNWDVNLYAGFSTIQDFGRSLRDANSVVELRRVIGDPATASAPSTQRTVVVDRFENERVDVLNQSQGESEGELSLREAVDRLTEVNAGSLLVPPERLYTNSQTRKSVAGIRLGRNDFYMTWARATRAWAFDVNGDGILSATELSPRYVFSYPSAARIPQDPDGTIDCRRTGTEEPPAQWRGERFSRDKDPDDNVDSGVNGGQWPRIELHDATNRLLEGKPVSFSNITLVDTAQTGPRIQITYQINGNPVPFVG
ncbi:MAG: hypothetical protein RIT24_530, partial [Planctomycetota bacterium]